MNYIWQNNFTLKKQKRVLITSASSHYSDPPREKKTTEICTVKL